MNLLLVGSFNPPTVGHLRMLEIGRDLVGCSGCSIISPVSDSYGKEGLISIGERMEMLNLSISGNIVIDSWEAEGDGGRWKRSRETVEHLKTKYNPLTLVVGSDFYNGLINEKIWPDEDITGILEKAGMIVIIRESEIDPMVQERLEKLCCWDKVLIHGEDKSSFSDLSSSLVRRLVREGRSIKYLVSDGCEAWIKKRGLYK